MTGEELPVTRYSRLAEEELRQRLEHEEVEAARQGQTEQARLLHELAVYQIELEMQNRELRETQAELETARDRYADLFDHAPVGYVTVDGKGYVRQANATAAELLRTTPARMRGQPFGIYVSKGDVTRLLHHLRRTFETNAAIVDGVRMKSLDGQTMDVRLVSRVRPDGGTEDKTCRIAIADLTAQRRAEAETRAQREALAHAMRLSTLGEMATGLAHELGQPLTAVRMYAQAARRMVAAESPDLGDLNEVMDKIIQQAERAGDTIQGIRRFARKEPPELHYEDVDPLVKGALDLMESELRAADVSVTVAGEAIIPRVYVDRTLFEHVLVNLVHNAVEAMGGRSAGHIRIDVTTPSRDLVEVAVTDDGPGIPEEQRETLFVPFKSSKANGLGMGLSLSRTLVEAMGGSLWLAASSPGGTTFKFTLPTYATE